MRFAPGSPSRVVANLAPGYDLRFTTAVDGPDATRILYDRVRCATKRSDIYAIDDR
jgi:hypothetical protein